MTRSQTAPAGAYDIIRGTVPHIHGEGYAFADPRDIISDGYSFRMKVRNGRERCEYFTKADRTGFRFADLGDRVILGSCCTDDDLASALSAAAFKWHGPLFIEGSREFSSHLKEIAASLRVEIKEPWRSNEIPDGAPGGTEEIIIRTDKSRACMFRLFCRILSESPDETVSAMFGDYLRRMAFDAIYTLENIIDPVRAEEDRERTEAGLLRLKQGGGAVLTEPTAVPEAAVPTGITPPAAAAVSDPHAAGEKKPSLDSPLQISEERVSHGTDTSPAGAAGTYAEHGVCLSRGSKMRDAMGSSRREEDSGLGL